MLHDRFCLRMPHRTRGVRLTVVSVLAALACASCTSGNNSSRRSTPTSSSDFEVVAAGADHDCVVPGQGSPIVDWAQLHNPILDSPSAGEKDEALIWFAGRWHMLFSYVRYVRTSPGGVYWDIASSTSKDLSHWTAPVAWPVQPGTLGVASPELAEQPDGTFVVTYQSDPGQTTGAQDRLYYRTSDDLVTWSPPYPLAQNFAPRPQDRMIDGSLAWTRNGLILGFKAGLAGNQQSFEIAWSPDGSLNGPWRYVGKPDIRVNGDTIERDEFLSIDGTWHLMATSNVLDQPWLFTLAGNPGQPSGWLDWKDGYELRVPTEAWDSGRGISSVNYEWANSAFLCNDRVSGGYYYLLYAGSDELTAFDGWGHAEIGIARSKDLVHWQAPG
jgi:hypothetical protein